jgi:hypothetical protein
MAWYAEHSVLMNGESQRLSGLMKTCKGFEKSRGNDRGQFF